MQRVTNEWIREDERRGEKRGEKRGELRGEKRGEKRGELRGKEQGRQEERRQIVLKMHHKGLSVAAIASLLELDAGEISAIIEPGNN